MTETPTPELLTIDQVQDLIELGKSTVYRMLRAGTFPQPLRISARAVRWRREEVQAWIDSVPRAAAAVQEGTRSIEDSEVAAAIARVLVKRDQALAESRRDTAAELEVLAGILGRMRTRVLELEQILGLRAAHAA